MKAAATRIGWIRHGQTEWNRLGKIQGIMNIPLSEEGISQAERLADRLASERQHRWQGIVCSDLDRAAKTAAIIADRLHIPVHADVRLRERSFGEAEGTTLDERIARWGDDWRRHVPDQETDEQMLGRGLSFVRDHIERHPGEAWLVVTHGSFLARMLHAMCRDLDDSHLLNVSLTIMERDGNGWKPLLHNCTKHLEDDAM